MRKFTRIAITVIAAIVLLFAALFFFMGNIAKNIDAELKPMMEDIVSNQWDKKTIEKYATDEFKQWLSQPQNWTGPMKQRAIELGAIKEYQPIDSFNIQKRNSVTTAHVKNTIIFEKGPRLMEYRLLKVDGKWRIIAFRWFKINPNAPAQK